MSNHALWGDLDRVRPAFWSGQRLFSDCLAEKDTLSFKLKWLIKNGWNKKFWHGNIFDILLILYYYIKTQWIRNKVFRPCKARKKDIQEFRFLARLVGHDLMPPPSIQSCRNNPKQDQLGKFWFTHRH